jgi:hypothetical protein
MQNELGFQGEIEFAEGAQLENHFGEFESLPNIDLIHDLAAEFSTALELMPYQKAGDVKRLLVSVYIGIKSKPGKVIAVLTRDPYPSSWNDLEGIMTTAMARIANLEGLNEVYLLESIDQARLALQALNKKIQQTRQIAGSW